MITTRAIHPQEWAQYKAVRLSALKDAPDAFGSTWGTESARTDESWFNQINAASAGTTDRAIFAVKGEHICGLLWCKLSTTRPVVASLYQMWVDPNARGLGIGRALLKDATDWACSKGAECIRLGVMAAESPAMHLYRSHGFTPVGEATLLRDDSQLMVQAMEMALVR